MQTLSDKRRGLLQPRPRTGKNDPGLGGRKIVRHPRCIWRYSLSESTTQFLSAWEDRPRRNLDLDVTSMKIDSRAAFVLTRADGLLTIAELCMVTGFGERETLKVVQQLIEMEALIVEEAEGERRMIRVTAERRPRISESQPVAVAAPFEGVDPADAAWLQRKGVAGFIPGTPGRLAGATKYGNFAFDTQALREDVEVTVEFRKDTLFLEAHLGKLDHFELFELEPTVDRKELRRAYFAFSKRFHPDTVFRRNVGSFGKRIETIFKHGTEVYEALVGDGDLREVYCRAVKARNRRWREKLEAQRANREEARRTELKKKAAGRKEALRARLARNSDRRTRQVQNSQMERRLGRAQRFYDEGIAHYENESWTSAFNSLQLAVTYDPKNSDYRAAFEIADEKLREVKAEQRWKRGYIQESLGNIKEALEAYIAAADAWPRSDYYAHIAELFLKYDEDLRQAADLAQKAVDAEPENVDYLQLLGRVYMRAKLKAKAVAVYEQIKKLEPKNADAKKALKALKRM